MLTVHLKRKVGAAAAMIGALMLTVFSAASASTLQDVKFAELPGNRFEVRLGFDALPSKPTGYTIEQPARIVLDFEDVDNALAQRQFPLSFENAKSAVVLSSDDRTRLILNLSELSAYTTREEGNVLVVEVGDSRVGDYLARNDRLETTIAGQPKRQGDGRQLGINDIDFRRGENGEGRVIVSLSNPSVSIDVDQHVGDIEISFMDTQLPQDLRRSLDVVDFATPVTMINADADGRNAKLVIKATGDYDYLAYQTDNTYVVSVKPLTKKEAEERQSRFNYVGEKLSLNFQDIEVRSVLQLIADFTELNLVASDTVRGNITLRLDNVPWDQALELVLKTKGLDKRQVGNVMMVAPAAEIAERERQELETQKQLQELAPLHTEYIRVRYASASELFKLFGTRGNSGGGRGGSSTDGNSTASILSERGSAIVDERTNSIILTDTADKIAEFKRLIDQVDIPIRQVMIEARIVQADTNFGEQLGIKWGAVGVDTPGNSAIGYGGGVAGDIGSGPINSGFNNNGSVTHNGGSVVDLGVANPAGSFAVTFLNDNFLLNLELTALQSSGQAEVVSQPKVITGDKQKAHIESGTEVPYQEASSSGATSTSFKDAVLKLDVTPQITPDGNIIMDLKINKDSVIQDARSVTGVPSISVTELQTQVLVANGQTVVLGGIFETEKNDSVTKVPFFGDLPYMGRLFRKNVSVETKKELLIFITPKILSDTVVK